MKETADFIGREELFSLIPHKGKMCLLSRVTCWDVEERTLRSECDVTADCLFYNPDLGGVPSWAAFEFMAQSISALSGLMNRALGCGPCMGFILSVSNMEIGVPVMREGAVAVIDVREDGRTEMAVTFNGEVYSGADRIACARLTVMEADDPAMALNIRDGKGVLP